MKGSEQLRGRRYVNLIRCSDDTQADTSPADQEKVLNEFAAERGLLHAGQDLVLAGVSGSIPGARADIDEVIARKRERDDFDVLLVQDASRLTRGGQEHGNHVVWELAAAGIEVIFATAPGSGNAEHDGILRTLAFYAAQQQAKSLSYVATRGQQSAIAAGTIPHTSNIPYGVDRLYVGPDGAGRHRVRNLPDGTQQLLDPTTEAVRSTLGRNPKRGSPIHYRRQSDERIVFVPGAAECVAVVREVYRRRLVEGHGAYRIAKSLNDRGLPSPTGKLWSTATVEELVCNPTYTGVGISGRYATGLYHLRGTDARPVELPRSLKDVATRKSRSPKLRTRESWCWQPHPLLVDFLGDDDLRERAVAYQARSFEKQDQKASRPKGTKAKPGGDRHVDSGYLLKGILRAKQGGLPMYGKTTGRPHQRSRYYRVSKSISTPQSGTSFSRMIPADALEQAVLDAVERILLDEATVRSAVEKAIGDQQKNQQADAVDLKPLLAEQAELTSRLIEALRMNEAARRLMAVEIGQWQARAAELERRVAAAKAVQPAVQPDAAAIASAAVGTLRTLGTTLRTMPPHVVRETLAALVGRLEVDLETLAVELELLLPPNATLSDAAVCLVGAMPRPTWNEAHRLAPLKLASVACEGTRGDRGTPACFKCSRKEAA